MQIRQETQNRWEQSYKPMSEKEKVQHFVDKLNQDEGNLSADIYDCPICKNKGFIYTVREDVVKGRTTYSEVATDCKCKATRKSIMNVKRSGLEPIIKNCRFENYETTEEWQRHIKQKAMDFEKNVDGMDSKCFFIGGAVGAGKTHLCTAITRSLILKGKSAKYMLWVPDSAKLKAMVNDAEYEKAVREYCNVDVLYIDDLFKITKDSYGKAMAPTSGDIRLAYEIINHRYINKSLITIISSERLLEEITDIDSATGSRIYEMAKDNAIVLTRDRQRNYRLKHISTI